MADTSAVEGHPLRFTVRLDSASVNQVVFFYATTGVTATANSDFISVSGSDTIPAGELTALLIVATAEDSEYETSETLRLTLSKATGAVFADSVAIGTITDNDAPLVSVASAVRPVLQNRCAIVGCHGGGVAQSGLSLGTTVTHASVLAATGNTSPFVYDTSVVVVPYNSGRSSLYTKVTVGKPWGLRMPSSGSVSDTLTTAQQTAIRDWINQGALNN